VLLSSVSVASKTVLLVDDSATHRSVVKVFLASLMLRFLDAEDAQSGLKILSRSPVDLVIADVKMPGMDGLEFVRAVRATSDRRVSRVPVVLITADPSEKLSREGIAAGADAFLHKPISNAGVLEVVERLLRSKSIAP
jgi:CheY-like chemotaxis protein